MSGAIFLNGSRVDNLFVGWSASVIPKTMTEYTALLYQEVSVWGT